MIWNTNIMPTKNKTKAVSVSSHLFRGQPLPSGQEIYDRLMENVEPELVTANLATLDAPYKKESAGARTARYKKYAKAFAEYKKQYKVWLQNVKNAVTAYKKAITRAVEKASKNTEDQALLALEAQMSAA